MNSYLNPLLQILRSTSLFRNVALRHVAGRCVQDCCLLCEIGFLCDMLERSCGKWCQATNFLLAYRSLPEGMCNLMKDDCGKLTFHRSKRSHPAPYFRGNLPAQYSGRENLNCQPVSIATDMSRLTRSGPL